LAPPMDRWHDYTWCWVDPHHQEKNWNIPFVVEF
jgi:hypothetical protein